MSTAAVRTDKPAQQPRLHTIGAVCARLQPEFPDISISKIRYLEDQGLLTPEAHAGRLPALQRGGRRAARDDPAPAAGRVPAAPRDPPGARRRRRRGAEAPPSGGPRRRRRGARPAGALRAGRDRRRARAGARGVRPARRRASRAGERLYRESDAEIAAACGRLAQFGIDARHLRTFRNSAGREAGLLEQLVAPALRSRNPERRKSGLEDLQSLAEASQELSRLLFWRELRTLAER